MRRTVPARYTRGRRERYGSTVATCGAAGLVVAALLAWSAGAPAAATGQGEDVRIEWLGWSFYRLTSPTGKVILINPWVQGNPDATITLADVERADLILASQGHPDDRGNTVQLAQQTGARVFVPFELGTWMIGQGVPMAQVVRSGPGGRLALDGITVRMVNAVHSSSVPGEGPLYGGLSAGYSITFENGYTVYFDGNSAATQDQALWAEMYKPNVFIFNMNPGREPMDIAMSILLMSTRNLNLQTLIPHHHRVEPMPGQTTVVAVQAAHTELGVDIQILNPQRGQTYSLDE